jgi:hypothetical protein
MTCERCGREVHPWPLERGARCSPRTWAMCIRNDGVYATAPEPQHPVDEGGEA